MCLILLLIAKAKLPECINEIWVPVVREWALHMILQILLYFLLNIFIVSHPAIRSTGLFKFQNLQGFNKLFNQLSCPLIL